jgi:hypothetical protein
MVRTSLSFYPPDLRARPVFFLVPRFPGNVFTAKPPRWDPSPILFFVPDGTDSTGPAFFFEFFSGTPDRADAGAQSGVVATQSGVVGGGLGAGVAASSEKRACGASAAAETAFHRTNLGRLRRACLAELITTSEAQLHEGDRVWGGSVERSCGPMNKNRIERVADRGERAEVALAKQDEPAERAAETAGVSETRDEGSTLN